MPKPIRNLADEQIGNWTILSYAGGGTWHCRCTCGRVSRVRTAALNGGASMGCKSCRRKAHQHPIRHGHARAGRQSREYRTWWAMLMRCDPQHCPPASRKYYTEADPPVKVCRRWHSFEHFLADMGAKPEGMQIDRRDPWGPYSPANCRWVTPAEQVRNRRTSPRHARRRAQLEGRS